MFIKIVVKNQFKLFFVISTVKYAKVYEKTHSVYRLSSDHGSESIWTFPFWSELVFYVTVPLGLWMFERPGELRLNHSWFNFKTVYWLSLQLHTVYTMNQFKHVDNKIIMMKDTNKVYRLPLLYNRWKKNPSVITVMITFNWKWLKSSPITMNVLS